MTTRALTADDFEQSLRLGAEAFGPMPAGTPPPDPARFPQPGRHVHGTFDGGRLVARVTGREFHSWFHGAEVATNGIAGVAVSPESRGRGLLDDLFRAVLGEGLEERGEGVSTLFPTAPGIYRRFGYELVSSYDTVAVPTAALGAVRPGEGVTLRRATADDMAEVRRVYDTWAAAQNGPLTRRGPSFPASDQEVLDEFTGITLACDDSGVVGYAAWERGPGYDQSSHVEVADLIALTRDATAELCRMLGTFSSVTGQVRFLTSGADAVRLVLPSLAWPVVDSHAYMLRVHDVVVACSGLRLGPGDRERTVGFSVAGDLLGTADGSYAVTASDGSSACERVPASDALPTFTPRGLALAWSGAQSCTNLRMAGLLTGPPDQDAAIDRLFGGRQLHVRDYF